MAIVVGAETLAEITVETAANLAEIVAAVTVVAERFPWPLDERAALAFVQE